jgi:hypothetical protein
MFSETLGRVWNSLQNIMPERKLRQSGKEKKRKRTRQGLRKLIEEHHQKKPFILIQQGKNFPKEKLLENRQMTDCLFSSLSCGLSEDSCIKLVQPLRESDFSVVLTHKQQRNNEINGTN